MTCTSGTLWSFTITYADAYVGKYEFCTQTGTTSGVCYDLNSGHRDLVATGFATIANVFGSGFSYGSDWLNTKGISKQIAAHGGYFTFDASSAATCKLRIDTVGGTPWLLDGKLVPRGTWNVVNKDTTKSFSFGVTDSNIVSILFHNEDYAEYKISLDLSSLSAMRPTSNLYLYNIPLATGTLADLSAMRPIGTLYLYKLPLVTGDLADLSAMRPTGTLYLVNMPLVTGDLADLSAMRPTGTLYLVNIPLVTGDLADLKDIPGTAIFQISLPLVSSCSITTGLFPNRKSINVSGCGLTQEAVDNLLAAMVNNAQTAGTLNITGGTNSTPSAAGLASKATLVARGWTVTHN